MGQIEKIVRIYKLRIERLVFTHSVFSFSYQIQSRIDNFLFTVTAPVDKPAGRLKAFSIKPAKSVCCLASYSLHVFILCMGVVTL